MASKNTKGKTRKPGKMSREVRRMRTTRIIFVVVSIILILSWILSLIVKI